MQSWHTTYLGLRELPREISTFELQSFFTYSCSASRSASSHSSSGHRSGDDALRPTLRLSSLQRCTNFRKSASPMRKASSGSVMVEGVPAEPLIVGAMPRARFTERLRLSARERQLCYGPHLFEPAQVMWVTKDKWAQVDSVYVRFLSEEHNHDPAPIACSITDESRNLLNAVARRDRLPVVKYGDKPAACAISRERKEYLSARRRAGSFLQATLKGARYVALPTDA
jgi:hypothetical protein